MQKPQRAATSHDSISLTRGSSSVKPAKVARIKRIIPIGQHTRPHLPDVVEDGVIKGEVDGGRGKDQNPAGWTGVDRDCLAVDWPAYGAVFQ
jgi:hypothetical protein